MFVQLSTIQDITKTREGRQIDFLVRDIANMATYVDSQIGANNELNEILANGNTTGGRNISFDSGDSPVFNNGGFTATLLEPTLIGNIDVTMPTATGTLALQSDIPVSTNLGNSDLANLATGFRTFTFGGSLSTDGITFENAANTDIFKIQGDGDINLYDSASVNYLGFDSSAQTMNSGIVAVGNKGTAAQYALKVYSRLASSSGIATFYNSSSVGVFDFRQAAGAGTLAVKNSSGTQQVYLNGSGGYVEALNNFRVNGATGLGGASGITYTVGGGGSGDLASMTFTGGILTAVTTVP